MVESSCEQRDMAVSLETNTTNEEFTKILNSVLHVKGKFQAILIILLSLNSIIIGINHTITAFHVYIPQFHCQDYPEKRCGHYVNGSECPSGYKFDEDDDRTVAVEFSAVCNKAMLAPLVNSLYFAGVTLGSLICSSFCDLYGRKKLVLICLYAQALMAVFQYYAMNFWLFCAFRLIQGFFVQGLQTCSYTLIMEYCPPRYRTIAATYWESNWAFGLLILGAVSYFIREWRLLTLTLAVPPVLISCIYVWMIPESIVWLETRNRRNEALQILKRIAKFNNRLDVLQQCNSIDLRSVKREENSFLLKNVEEPNTSSGKLKLMDIIKCRVLRLHLISMICIWFSVTLSYYGILYYLPNLAGQRHLNFEIGAFIELAAYIIAYFTLSRLGRKLPMICYQWANGLLILTVAVLTALPSGSYSQAWVVGITLIAKGLAVSSFCAMFIYCSELLPTVCRGLGLGLCGCSARCGSLLAPQLMALVTVIPQYMPLSIMAILLLATGTVTLYLPETLSIILPNTFQEAVNLWDKSIRM